MESIFQHSCIDLEKLKKTITDGEEFLKSISRVHPMEIKCILENIYAMYEGQFSEVLQNEYEKYREFDITYDNNGNITSASLKWNYWDAGEVRLICTGVEVVYIPEIGSQKIIAELPLEIVKTYFKEILK